MRKKPGLISLGCAALIAGCGGGGGGGNSPGRALPPTNSGTGPMVTANVRLQIPARGSQTTRKRGPKWISPSSTTLGVRVLGSPAPNPTPTETVVTIPTPGPVPTSFNVQVQAPISNDTFVATLYDGSHNLLATGSSAPIQVSLNSTPQVSVTMLGVASGVQYTVSGSTPNAWRVLENLSVPQTTSMNAQPVDADGNLIPGPLAIPVSLTGTSGISISPALLSAAANITVTYQANTGGSGSVNTPLTLNSGNSSLNAVVNGDYYVFVANDDGSVDVIDGLTQTPVGSPLTSSATTRKQIAALSGCANGAYAVAGNSNGAFEYSVAAPTTANPTPIPVSAAITPALLVSAPFSTTAAADAHCNVFYANGSNVANIAELSGFDSTLAGNTAFASGFLSFGLLKSIGGQLYLVGSPTANVAQAAFVSETTGGAATLSSMFTVANLNPIAMPAAAGTGSSVFFVSNLCTGQPVLQSLSGGSLITLSQFSSVSGVFQANDGTVYLAGNSAAAGTPPLLTDAPLGSIVAAPGVTLGANPVDVAVTPDQQFVCVLESPNGSNGQIEFFRRSPALALVATVPLSGSSIPDSFSIGP